MSIINFPEKREDGIIKPTEKQKRAIKAKIRIEKFYQRMTLLKARVLGTGISPDDTRTLQAHKDGSGDLRDYYISNMYLQEGASYIAVTPILEDEEKSRYVYRGLVAGADNATGVIESNVSISEIVASPSGNVKLQEMLLEENAMKVSKAYWKSIGESEEPLKGHSLNFGKPDFVLGTIQREKKGKFTFTSEISPDIEEMLEQERADMKKEDGMRIADAVEIDLGGGMVIAIQDCWMQPGQQIKFAGINSEALFFLYEPNKPIKTPDGKYVYIGTMQIGQSRLAKQTSNMPIQFESPFVYDDVVVWTENKNLIQYHMEHKLSGLNLVLGEMFTNGNMKKLQKGETTLIVGGITLDAEGKCIETENVPESVITAVEEYFSHQRGENNPKVIEFIPDQRD